MTIADEDRIDAANEVAGIPTRPRGPGTNSGHGHVWQRPDGIKARCGGPALGCPICQMDDAVYGPKPPILDPDLNGYQYTVPKPVAPHLSTITPNLSEPEPAPIPNDRPAVWDLVIRDMQERDQTGEKKYGVRLQPHNGRDPLIDAYQEILDAAVYLRQAIYEATGK